jgi:pyruvate formate lyase activating enzyme
MDISGRVLRIEKTSIYDGQGLRTVVFLKGCPLRCKWCSTPEAQNFEAEFGYGTDMTVSEVVEEISKDEIFFFHSGGGVTISGGEVLVQEDFAAEILKECLKRGIHTAIESSFYSDYGRIEKLMPYLKAVYVDIKHMDDKAHRAWTGVSNTKILENIHRLDRSCYPAEVHVRIPVIPGINNGEENLLAVTGFCQGLKKLRDIELLPYHRLGINTYKKMGKEYELMDVKPPSKETLHKCAEFMANHAKGLEIIAGEKVFASRD